MKHTPGPWAVITGRNPKEAGRIQSASDKTMAVIPAPHALGEASDVPYYERAANATLIAAAPEMYEALRLMLIATMPDEDGYTAPTQNVFEQARAAFNKATRQG
jgi:hypothetical protein